MPTDRLFVQVTGWMCVGMLGLLLFRSVAGKKLRVFPFFYSYIAHILITTVIGLSVRWPTPQAYRTYWWVVECISTLVGIGVTWEIHRKILVHYAGVRRLVAMLLSIIFGSVLLASAATRGDERSSMLALDRDVRTVQAIVLLIL